jgi:hypothetical protein
VLSVIVPSPLSVNERLAPFCKSPSARRDGRHRQSRGLCAAVSGDRREGLVSELGAGRGHASMDNARCLLCRVTPSAPASGHHTRELKGGSSATSARRQPPGRGVPSAASAGRCSATSEIPSCRQANCGPRQRHRRDSAQHHRRARARAAAGDAHRQGHRLQGRADRSQERVKATFSRRPTAKKPHHQDTKNTKRRLPQHGRRARMVKRSCCGRSVRGDAVG